MANATNMRTGSGTGGHGGSYRTNSGGRFGASGSGSSASGTWNSITSNPTSSSVNKLNHHGMGYPANTLNPHSSHSNSHNNNNNNGSHHPHSVGGNGGRRGYGEATEPTTMPPPPRSVQMSQCALPAPQARADLIPQPRHAKANSSFTSNTPKPMERPPLNASPTPDIAAPRRWASSTSTPTPRSAHSNPPSAALAPANIATAHHDPHIGPAVPRPAPSPPFVAAAEPRTTPTPPLPPPAPAPAAAAAFIAPCHVPAAAPRSGSGSSGGGRYSNSHQHYPGNSGGLAGGAVSGAVLPPPPPPAPHATAATAAATVPPPISPPSSVVRSPHGFTSGSPAKAPLTSPLEALHLSEHLIFDARDLDAPAAIQPSEIEALLGQVERSTAAAPKEATMGGSLRERRSVADWGIEEAIKSVLPGMDEDDNSDDLQGPNVLSGNVAAISGSWHTTGEPDVRQPVGVGLLADFPTSFAASFSEPVSAVLGSPFAGDPAINTMDNLSRAFSTAARVDSSSFTTSPATTSAATPPQRPPNSPGMRLPHYTSPDDVVTMPPSTAATATQPPSAVPPPAAPNAARTEVTNDSVANTSGLLASYAQPPPAGTSPWLASGLGESLAASVTAPMPAAGAPAATAAAATGGAPPPLPPRPSDSSIDFACSKASSGSVEKAAAERPPEAPAHGPHGAAHRPSLLQSIPIKNGSIDSSFGLTASIISANSPAVPSTRQSTITASAPNTPSLRKETSTPLSATRGQAYGGGATGSSSNSTARPQRPSLSAPVVNRHTITQVFRETPQSLLQKEAMRKNHESSPDALCRDPHWPPHNKTEAEEMLRGRGAVKLLRHLTIIAFSRQNVAGVQELFDTWAKNGIPAPDMGFGAYYYYVKEKSAKVLCMKHNGRGPSPGHGYGRCDFESRRPFSTCRYEHVCLFCRSAEHGWFEEGRCEGYQSLLQEMVRLGVVEEDVVALLNAIERDVKQEDKQKVVR